MSTSQACPTDLYYFTLGYLINQNIPYEGSASFVEDLLSRARFLVPLSAATLYKTKPVMQASDDALNSYFLGFLAGQQGDYASFEHRLMVAGRKVKGTSSFFSTNSSSNLQDSIYLYKELFKTFKTIYGYELPENYTNSRILNTFLLSLAIPFSSTNISYAYNGIPWLKL